MDDNPLVRTATASLLRSYGYRTVEYSCGEDLVATDLEGVDCIVSDVQMPEMSGMDLFRRLRADGRGQPVILMTAYPNARLEHEARDQGVHAVIEKPLDGDTLEAVVASSLDTAISRIGSP